jgi:hypothetical protein
MGGLQYQAAYSGNKQRRNRSEYIWFKLARREYCIHWLPISQNHQGYYQSQKQFS